MVAIFEGIRVLEFAGYIVGPFAGAIMARMGAEVIHVESNAHLDFFRVAPRRLDTFEPLAPNEQRDFSYLNQGKKGILLNLRQPEGLRLAKELVAISDVIIENLAFGSLARLGLVYDNL